MKKLLLFIGLIFCCLFNLHAQYWQQQADFTIEVKLNEKEKTLDGFEKIIYTNNSPDTLHFIWFHVWMNAYKNDQTAFTDQQLKNGNTKFYFSNKEEKGYINRMDFKIDGISARIEDHPQHLDIIKILLPAPLLPGAKATITTPFHVKLPYIFSRSGYSANYFNITQWYPKPAVYDIDGWHPMPYLDQGEFYNSFGDYDVRITVPQNFVVASTGVLHNEDEQQWLKTRSNVVPEKKKISNIKKPASKVKSTSTTVKPAPTETEMKTLRFTQQQVHDFAWFANKDFLVEQDTCQLPGGKIISVSTYYTPAEQSLWKNHSLNYTKDAVRFYSSHVGEYPYETVSVVQGVQALGGGMEYPTITVIGSVLSDKTLDNIIAHEVGHNWFQGILANNERQHTWMDEGINSFYEKKYMQEKYGDQPQDEEMLFLHYANHKKDQPINLPAEKYSWINYGLITYHKSARWFQLIENEVGEESFRRLMKNYFEQWKFKHPKPVDFKNAFAPALAGKADEIFNNLYKSGPLPNQKLSGFKIITPLKPKSIQEYRLNPTSKALVISPAVGYNVYDQFMIGGLISNYKIPLNPFKFVAVPLYATGSKQLNAIARIGYSIIPSRTFEKAEFFISGSRFSMNEYTNNQGTRHTASFSKLVPGIELVRKEKDPLSTKKMALQWKSFFINEQAFRFAFDSVITPIDTTIIDVITTSPVNFTIHQLQFNFENKRVLYPYSAIINAQASSYFFRFSFEGNYFFNYADGGLNVRMFAGKFIEREFDNTPYGLYIDRFYLNMTGAKGEEDYTYSNYFIGRNKFEGLASRQIVIRDGGFKIRTDLLSNKIGKTNNWLMALNFNSSVPSKINPLALLPIKIPLHVFADIGTYADTWKPEAEMDKIIFDAGLHIPLMNGLVNFYFPIFYSPVYSDYVKSIYTKNKFFQTMSFDININHMYKRVNRYLFF
ncbi:MAG: M1 family metallopeptidase [Flavisolibacter sp.]|nr:M1 family metallopeptidase [Flavisolibacter sp.]